MQPIYLREESIERWRNREIEPYQPTVNMPSHVGSVDKDRYAPQGRGSNMYRLRRHLHILENKTQDNEVGKEELDGITQLRKSKKSENVSPKRPRRDPRKLKSWHGLPPCEKNDIRNEITDEG